MSKRQTATMTCSACLRFWEQRTTVLDVVQRQRCASRCRVYGSSPGIADQDACTVTSLFRLGRKEVGLQVGLPVAEEARLRWAVGSIRQISEARFLFRCPQAVCSWRRCQDSRVFLYRTVDYQGTGAGKIAHYRMGLLRIVISCLLL